MALAGRWGGRRAGAVVALAVAVLAAACSGSGYQYVSNRDAGTWFKVPDDWELFEVTAEGRPDAVAPSRAWQVIFDAAPSPSMDNLQAPAPEYPVGVAQIVTFTSEGDRSAISLSSLRAMAIGGQADPLALIEDGNDALELVDYGDVVDDDGHHGNRIVLNLRRDDDTFVTVGQIAMVDPATRRVYRLLVTCEASCYDRHRTEIDRVMDSWTIEPTD